MIEYLQENWVSLVGACIGLLYLYLEYKANILMWLASIVMAVFYIYIFYETSLYAMMTIYIYFFGASIYGWIKWIMKHKSDTETINRTIRAPKGAVAPTIIITIFTSILIFIFLHIFSENSLNIMVGDAITTSLNVTALWMVSRKWAEQWLLVIPANALSSILLYIQGDILSSILFFIYFIVSIAGYHKWKKLAIEE